MTRCAAAGGWTRLLVAGVVFLALVPLVSCTRESDTLERRLRTAITRTERVSRSFVYSEVTKDRTVKVQGDIQDDLRYRIDLEVDGDLQIREVVVDDASAVQVLNPSFLERFNETQDASNVPVDLLRQGGWVVDPLGAASLAPASKKDGADDPILDALTALRYVDRALSESSQVRLFNPESAEYRPQFDPFPRPDVDRGEIRYDFDPPPLPPRQDPRTVQPGQQEQTPGPEHFRKLAMYMRENRIVRVLEVIDTGRELDDLIVRLNDAGIRLPSTGSVSQRRGAAVDALNALRSRRGGDPVRLRRLTFELSNIGRTPEIGIPPGAATGNLRSLLDRGQVLQQSGL